ncbi:MAG TPA: hypothetical protein DCQ93_04780, partial [Bacteroidetes bacterium]|nr:hypothetical protein [Bacteroidota bacterium]
MCAGFYCGTITDANGCPCEACEMISEPDALQVSILGTDATICQGNDCDGSADLLVSGGTSPYIYSWSNGATTEDLSGLCSGYYSVTVTDLHGCTMISDIDISCIPPPPPCNLQAAGESTNAICYGTCGGSVNLTVVGGTSRFSYNWSN